MNMGKVISVCVSDRKGIQKTDVKSAYFETEWGIRGYAPAGAIFPRAHALGVFLLSEITSSFG